MESGNRREKYDSGEINILLPQEEFRKLGSLYGVLADPIRIQIIYLLYCREMCVSDIAGIINASQSNISHHLALLKAYSLVGFRKQGKQVIYFLKDAHIHEIVEMGLEHIKEKS